MSFPSKGINFTDSRKLIKTLVSKKCIKNFNEFEQKVESVRAELDKDDREVAHKVFGHLIKSFQKFIPTGNLPLFYELAKVLLDSSGEELLRMSKEKPEQESLLKEEMAHLSKLLQQYWDLSRQMKCTMKESLAEDLMKNGNLGEARKRLDLSAAQYEQLYGKLLSFVNRA